MDEKIIEIIEEYEYLIEENEWEEIYYRLEEEKIKIIGAFTEIMLSVGINPLEHLDSVPNGYLAESTITDIHIPKHITGIGKYAFSSSSLENITFEKDNQLTSIGAQAFYNTGNLKNITIPSSVTDIGDYAFENSSLESIEFEEDSRLLSIGWSAFVNTTNLKSIVIPSSVTRIGSYAFRSNDLIIYAEAESQPSGWHNNWNPLNRPVVWGYKEE